MEDGEALFRGVSEAGLDPRAASPELTCNWRSGSSLDWAQVGPLYARLAQGRTGDSEREPHDQEDNDGPSSAGNRNTLQG